jgi:hypothetical protein
MDRVLWHEMALWPEIIVIWFLSLNGQHLQHQPAGQKQTEGHINVRLSSLDWKQTYSFELAYEGGEIHKRST